LILSFRERVSAWTVVAGKAAYRGVQTVVDEAKLHQFVGQMLSDLGGAVSIALVRMGDNLGLYKTLHAKGPMTVAELAGAAGVDARYLREWASHHAASNYLSYDPQTQKFALSEEQAMVFAIEDSPVNMIGAFDAMVAILGNQDKVQPVFKNGGGVSWGDQSTCLFCRHSTGLSRYGCPRSTGWSTN